MATIPNKSTARIIAEAIKNNRSAQDRPTRWNVREEDTQHGYIYESNNTGDYWYQYMYGTRDDAVKGTNHADYINSGAGNDVIWGLGGNDILDGDYGNDIIIAGSGANTHSALYGGKGNDLLVGGYDLTIGHSSSDFINQWRKVFNNVDGLDDASLKSYFVENSSNNAFFGGEGNDTIIGSSGNNKVEGGEGHDLIMMGNGANDINAGSGNDTIMVGNGANRIDGGEGDDLILVGSGRNTIDGGDGVDILGFQNSATGVYADLNQPSSDEYHVIGNTSFKNIEGFYGSKFNDTLDGDSYDNLFDGGGGQDIIDGHGGNDTLSFGSAGQGVSVNIDSGTASLEDGTSLGSFVNIENIVGSGFADTIVGDAGDNLIDMGGGSKNKISAGAGNDTIVSSFETLPYGNSYIYSMQNTIDGGDGFDIIDYSNVLRGLQVDLGTQKMTYFTGYEWAIGDIFTSIEGVKGHLTAEDTLIAGSAGHYMDGQGGNDLLISGAGADTLIGGEGKDTISYERSISGVKVNLQTGQASGGYAQGDHLSGFEAVIGSDHDDSIVGSNGGTYIKGGAGNDTLIGGSGNDTIEVGTGSNYVVGGAGDDTFISAGGGNNIFDGGEGSDAVSYAQAAQGMVLDLSGQDATGDRLINIEKVIGTIHNDTIYGSDQNETIDGGGGTDMIYGSRGADLLSVSGVNSTINYSLSDAGVNINLQTGAASGGYAEGDTIAAFYHAVGSAHNDTLMGRNTIATKLEGGDGDDLLIAYGNANYDQYNTSDTLIGGAGNDTLIGGSGGDLLDGGEGMDIVDYSSSNKYVYIGLPTNYASGGHAQGDTLISIEGVIGTRYNDTVVAGPNAGYFDLGMGNDSMISGAGADTIEGGAGVDTLSYATSTAGVNVNLTTGISRGGDAEGDVISGFEVIIGSNFDDTLTGSITSATTLNGGNGNDYFYSNAGATNIIGGAGIDTVDYSNSTAGVTISSNRGTGGYAAGDVYSGIEVVVGSNHNDFIDLLVNNATLYGGAGNDTMQVTSGNNYVNGGEGQDVVSYQNAYGTAMYADFRTGEFRGGQLDKDTLISIEGIIGATSNDTFHGGYGASYIDGGGGNDVLYSHGSNTTLMGGSGNDTLYGSEFDETLIGGDGNDLIMVSGGRDYIDGGVGNDSISYALSTKGVMVKLTTGEATGGMPGGDTIVNVEGVIGSDHDDTIYGSQAIRDTLDGGAGNDYFYASSAQNSIQGGAGIDTVDYSLAETGVIAALDGYGLGGAVGDTIMGVEVLVGSKFDDSLVGSTRNDTLIGGAGNDTLYGGVGADYLDGGEGSDWASYTTSNAAINVNLATGVASGGHAAGDTLVSIENVIGSNYNDTIIGNASDNYLTGNNGNDSLVGGAGNDTLCGGVGNDTLDGGTGLDVAEYSLSNQAVNVNLATGVATGGHAQGDKLISIEGVIGSNYNDTVTGSADANLISTGVGNDSIIGSAGADTIDGGAGVDTLDYSGSNAGISLDLKTGLGSGGFAEGDVVSGIEVVIGSAYNDTLLGDAQNNYFEGGAGADVIDGRDGIDTVSYAAATGGVNINLAASPCKGNIAEGDVLSNIEYVIGSNFDDTLAGGTGNETLYGGGGNDLFIGSAGADFLIGGPGSNTVDYSLSDAAVVVNLTAQAGGGGHAEGDKLAGFTGVIGSAFNDSLTGTTGNDLLRGGAGNDTLAGAAGADTLDGGDGLDVVAYYASNQAVNVNLATGTAIGGHAQGDVLISIEGVIGSNYNDTITGSDGTNLIIGGNGADFIYGSLGADTIDGGAGQDTVSYANSSAGVYVNLGTGEARGGLAEGDVLSNIEVVIGSAYSDTIIGTTGNDTFYSSGGGDHFDGGAGTNKMTYENATSAIGFNIATGGFAGIATGDTYVNIQQFKGSNFNDTIMSGDLGSWIDVGFGNDYVYAGAGKDNIYGVAGIDTVDYSLSNAGISINLQTGVNAGGYAQGDTLYGIEGVIGSNFNDILVGRTNTSNTLVGGAGNDWLRGTTGTNDGYVNYLDGGAGDDTLVANRGVETLIGGEGFDIVDYQYVNVGVGINLATGIHFGDARGDMLVGIEGIAGSRFADTIVGDDKDNLIYGAGGSNTLTGGAGADTFGYNYDYKSAISGYARDVITDFSESDGDQILIYSKTGTGTVGYKEGGTATPPNTTHIVGYFEKHNIIMHNSSDFGTVLMVDANGDGNWSSGDFQIKLDGVANFDASSITWTNERLKL